MRILIAAQYFWPETVGAGVWIHQLASDLVKKGHLVTVLTAFPNYPHGEVLDGYRRRLFMRETTDGIDVRRTYIYATRRRSLWPRAFSFGSFCLSAPFGAIATRRPDVIYAVLPPLPLGLTMELVGAAKRVPVVINVQDIYPDIAVSLGYLKNRIAISLFQVFERLVYKLAAAIVVITESFEKNLLEKEVPHSKIQVIPNWADSSYIQPAPKDNAFRKHLNVDGSFLVVYSGGMGHNTCLDTVIEAARLVADEPYQFALVGDGAFRQKLEEQAAQYELRNVHFLPFQRAEDYPQVLSAADVQLVTLNPSASQMSLPSKVLKIMASGRPVLALASRESDLAQLLARANCGVVIDPENPMELANALRGLSRKEKEMDSMGQNARSFFLEHFDREKCVTQIEEVLRKAANV